MKGTYVYEQIIEITGSLTKANQYKYTYNNTFFMKCLIELLKNRKCTFNKNFLFQETALILVTFKKPYL